MKRILLLTATMFIFFANLLNGQSLPTVDLLPLPVKDLNKPSQFARSIYTLDARFTSRDTLLLLNKVSHLYVLRVDSVSAHELSCQILVDSGFVDFGVHKLVVMGPNFNKKAYVQLNVHYQNFPVIDDIIVKQSNHQYKDTVVVSHWGNTYASLMLKGHGLFRTSKIVFSDANIHVLDNPSWRIDFPPDSIRIGIEIEKSDNCIGLKKFRIANEYGLEGFGEIYLRSQRPPRVISNISNIIGDGKEKVLTLLGENFFKGLKVSLLPHIGITKTLDVSPSQIKLILTIPITESTQSARLIVTNPDGQADTTGYFTIQAPPLSKAQIRTVQGGEIFLGKPTQVVIAVDVNRRRRLRPNRSYEINIEGERFPITSVINDSICEAVITIPENPTRILLNQHVFTINEVGHSALWKGTVKTKPAPKITYVSENRILHPSDTLHLIIKGKNLSNASLYIEDPEVTFAIIEKREDLLRVKAIAGAETSFGSYPLQLRIHNVRFPFNNYRIVVQPWQPFNDYVGIETNSLGFLSPTKLWRKSGIAHLIERNDVITLKIFTNRIREDLGEQKFFVSAVLMDSTNTVRAEALNKKMIIASKGTDVISWQMRMRERTRSGDRIEVTLTNPGNMNKTTEVFYVKPHWSESFHGSTSFILFKIPFGGGGATTEILRSVSIGISYQPYYEKNFLAFDGSFIIGNVASGDDNLSIDVGLGFSVILWQHIQIGIGTNLTGGSSTKAFTFVGTRFKIPIPLK